MMRKAKIEWVTFGMIVACYTGWLWVLFSGGPPVLTIPALAVLIAFHGSLTHEVLHGHPFPSRKWNERLMALQLNLVIPYERFRDTHLAHHRDSRLTDPYDDPESNFADPDVWARQPRWKQALYRFNNTLGGRLLTGAALGQVRFMADDLRLARAGDGRVITGWLKHLPGAALILILVAAAPMPVWAYLLAAYGGLSLLRIRTFLEHRAHDDPAARTVIIETPCPLAVLFLFNNLHAVHHRHPQAPWYRLPALYRADKAGWQAANGGYVYRSYAEIFHRYFFRAKDPVPHPLWRKE